MVLSRVRGTIRRGQELDRSRCHDSASSALHDNGCVKSDSA